MQASSLNLTLNSLKTPNTDSFVQKLVMQRGNMKDVIVYTATPPDLRPLQGPAKAPKDTSCVACGEPAHCHMMGTCYVDGESNGCMGYAND